MDNVKALSNTVFTEKHTDIAGGFVARVISLLKEHQGEPKTYAIQSERWEDKESLKLNITDDTTLEIHFVRRK